MVTRAPGHGNPTHSVHSFESVNRPETAARCGPRIALQLGAAAGFPQAVSLGARQ